MFLERFTKVVRIFIPHRLRDFFDRQIISREELMGFFQPDLNEIINGEKPVKSLKILDK